MLDDGDGSKPYCALQDLYTDVDPQDSCCQWWQGEVKDQQRYNELIDSIREPWKLFKIVRKEV
jgi:hypothetical protein